MRTKESFRACLESRRLLVSRLYALGITVEQVADLVRVCVATVVNDLRALRETMNFDNRPTHQADIFRAVFKRYIELMTGDETNGDLTRALARWLDEDRLIGFIIGFETAALRFTVSIFPSTHQGYAELLRDMFGLTIRVKPVTFDQAAEIWKNYLLLIGRNEIPVPCSRTEVEQSLACLCDRDERRLAVVTGLDEKVFSLLDKAIADLPARDAKVIRDLYGIETVKKDQKELMVEFRVSSCERVRQIRVMACRRLARLNRFRQLKSFLLNYGQAMNAVVEYDEARERTKAELGQSIERLTAQMLRNLFMPVVELELSVRSAACLEKADIRLVGELVQKNGADLLKTRNFGRKSLHEIKEILGDLGLSLGMDCGAFSELIAAVCASLPRVESTRATV